MPRFLIPVAWLAGPCLAWAVCAGAHAGGVTWSVGVYSPGVVVGASNGAPLYHGPPPAVIHTAPPVVYGPPPVVYGPPPVVYGPPPVVIGPPPVIYGSPAVVYAPPRVIHVPPPVRHAPPHGAHRPGWGHPPPPAHWGRQGPPRPVYRDGLGQGWR